MASLLARIFGSGAADLPEWVKGQQGLRKRVDLSCSVLDAEYVAFDTELTGLDFKKDSIISIGALRLKGSAIQPASSFYRLVKPETELKRKSVVVHEITPSELQDAAPLQEVIADFVEFIGDAILIGHFVHIDVNFINRALKRYYGARLQNRRVDTASLHDWLYDNDSRFARHYQGMTTREDLFSQARKYGVPTEKAHNALYDAYLTAQLFQRFLFFLFESDVKRLKDLLNVGKP